MYSSKKPSLKDVTLIMYQQKINGLLVAVEALQKTQQTNLDEYKTLKAKLEYFTEARKNYLNNIK